MHEINTMIMVITKVDHEGGGVETEMIAIRPKRILKGLGMTIRRSCHQSQWLLGAQDVPANSLFPVDYVV
jgi:hypothetical protein